MDVDLYDRGEDDVDLKTPVRNQSHFSNHRRAEDTSNHSEQTPKPSLSALS